MRNTILRFTMLLFLTFFALGPANTCAESIKLAHLGKGDPFEAAGHAGAVNFGHILNKLTAGKYTVEIYPRGTLGKEMDLVQAVRSGVVEIIIASMVSLHRIFPPAQVGMAPYAFKNDAVAWEVLDGPFSDKLLDALTEKTGIQGLIIQDLGFLTITNNKRPLAEPEDFEGIKFRAMGPLQANMFKALGASAVPIPWPEVYTSLQTGVVDGQTNAAFVVKAFKLHEVQKYMSLANSQMGYQIYLCNKQWYDALSPADRRALHHAAESAKQSARSMSILLESRATKALAEEGMTITTLSDDQVTALQKLAGPACIKWLKTQMDPMWVDTFLSAVKGAEQKLGF